MACNNFSYKSYTLTKLHLKIFLDNYFCNRVSQARSLGRRGDPSSSARASTCPPEGQGETPRWWFEAAARKIGFLTPGECINNWWVHDPARGSLHRACMSHRGWMPHFRPRYLGTCVRLGNFFLFCKIASGRGLRTLGSWQKLAHIGTHLYTLTKKARHSVEHGSWWSL